MTVTKSRKGGICVPREYQTKKSGVTLPQTVYMRVKYALRDYERMRSERERIMHGGFGGAVHRALGAPIEGDPTGDKAVIMAELSGEVDAIERALHDVAAMYVNCIKRDDVDYFDALGAYADYGLFCYMLYDPKTDRQPCRQTWQNFKSTLAYQTALNLGYICAA